MSIKIKQEVWYCSDRSIEITSNNFESFKKSFINFHSKRLTKWKVEKPTKKKFIDIANSITFEQLEEYIKIEIQCDNNDDFDNYKKMRDAMDSMRNETKVNGNKYTFFVIDELVEFFDCWLKEKWVYGKIKTHHISETTLWRIGDAQIYHGE